MAGVDARILGQILLIESLVAQLPHKHSMLQFAARGLEQVPGVLKVWFQDEPFVPDARPVHPFEIHYNGHLHAVMCFLVEDGSRFEPLVPYLKNLAFMLGLVLDERAQREENERYRNQLEHLVEARTRALAESEAQFRSYIENAPIGVFIADEKGRYLQVNPAASQITGFSREELLGMGIPDITPLEGHGAALETFHQILEAGHAIGELPFRHKDGRVRCWQVDAVKLSPSRFLGFTSDITERKRDEEALRKASAAVEQSPIAIFITDTGGVIQYVNRAFTEYTGYDPEEALGRTPSLLKSGEHSPDFYRELWDCLAKGQTWRGRFHNRRKDGELYWEQAVISPLRDADGRISHYLASKENITEALRLEEERHRLELQVARAQRMESLGSLAGGVAHDMNNVLAAILSLASVHQMTATEGTPLRAALDTIATACLRGRSLVQGLLGFARKELVLESVLDLNALVREEVALLERTTMQRVKLRLDLAEGLSPIKGDPAALSHALMNLCVNALDALPDGGTLTLKTRAVGRDQVQLDVHDNGCGMSREVLEKAFDPFFTTKAPGKGTGLGLPMVYRTVEAHHGQIDVQSTPGLGTNVTITLPASGEVRASQESEVRTGVEGQGLRVLLVDDDDLIRQAVGSLLEAMGHAAAIADSGEKALEMLEQGLPCDAVILDLHMPGLGGARTLPLLRALRPHIPILLATGNADQEAMRLAEAHRMVTLLPKPYTFPELRKHLVLPSRV